MKREIIIHNLHEFARVTGDEESEVMIAAAREIMSLEARITAAVSAFQRLATQTNISAMERIEIASDALRDIEKMPI